ncbi:MULTISPECIES: isochorismatase family protein [unclassified Amycolatopsis]|uniref:isochorismatase family protein n=1 Tax=unclassified Amycolatopsis TaxID=2618356 RepID=UPI001C6959D1|nr:isochorismatase family protein [Amycolatopsis sp. DSM 110486]QYN18511.1 isochorismatase family protein [Amycolatopsis sp. DSM 110486]
MVESKFIERLTRDNAMVVLVDHQVGLYSGVRDIAVEELKHNVVGLAKAAQVLGLPLVVSTTEADGMWGPLIPELAAVLPDDVVVLDRSTVNAWDDERVQGAIRATGRKKVIFAGVSTEVCLAFPAISVTAEGFDAYAAIDASGTFSRTKREAGLLRMQQAGVIPIDYATAMVEVLADNSDPQAGYVYAALEMPFAVLVGQIAAGYAKN